NDLSYKRHHAPQVPECVVARRLHGWDPNYSINKETPDLAQDVIFARAPRLSYWLAPDRRTWGSPDLFDLPWFRDDGKIVRF
ncbi:MAG: hypothetical protein AAF267_25320, partial [Deinococcota bacterium]